MVREFSVQVFLLNTIISVLYGLVVAILYMYKNKHSKTMALTLVVLPAMVQAIIMLVSGNIGAGIAVAGAFSLVRFRSATGNARDIGYLFFAMVLGFITGMGFVGYAFLFLIVIGCAFVIMEKINFGKGNNEIRILKIVIPENLDFNELFDDIFNKYTNSSTLDRVKSTNMGSLYELTFSVILKNSVNIKAFIDELRTRNGNLNIFLSREVVDSDEL